MMNVISSSHFIDAADRDADDALLLSAWINELDSESADISLSVSLPTFLNPATRLDIGGDGMHNKR